MDQHSRDWTADLLAWGMTLWGLLSVAFIVLGLAAMILGGESNQLD